MAISPHLSLRGQSPLVLERSEGEAIRLSPCLCEPSAAGGGAAISPHLSLRGQSPLVLERSEGEAIRLSPCLCEPSAAAEARQSHPTCLCEGKGRLSLSEAKGKQSVPLHCLCEESATGGRRGNLTPPVFASEAKQSVPLALDHSNMLWTTYSALTSLFPWVYTKSQFIAVGGRSS